jgi:ABC-type transport system involved in multi-copper enzyme maturation permease subunit
LRKIALLLLVFSDIFLIVGLALFGFGITHTVPPIGGPMFNSEEEWRRANEELQTPNIYNYDQIHVSYGILSIIGGSTFLILAYKKRQTATRKP